MKQTYRKTIENILVTQKKYLDKDFSAKELARILDVPTYKLSRVMHAEFGMSYPDFVLSLRVKKAMKHLSDRRLSNCTIDDVGSMVGFGNRMSFFLAFKRFAGTTPEQYRNSKTKYEEGI